MSADLITVHPNTIMTDISQIFDEHTFHHLPVIDDNGACVGVISKSDYYQLQNCFTKINSKYSDMHKNAEVENERFFKSIVAQDVMTENPVCVDISASIDQILDVFIENKIHSVIVTESKKCMGIITTYDIIREIKEQEKTTVF